MHDYLAAVRALTDRIEHTQLPTVERAADLVAESLLAGGVLYCHELGHGLQGDFTHRAGGMAALRRFSFKLDVQDDVAPPLRKRPRDGEPLDRTRETIRVALRTSTVRPGDVMLLGSVSGRNVVPVELALACRDFGVKTIAFTAFDYTANVASLHASGLRLKDAVDIAIDIGAPYGDAAVRIEGYESELLPVSGVGTLVTGWLLMAEVMRRMAAAGKPATVFQSVNRAGGEDRLRESHERYDQKGY